MLNPPSCPQCTKRHFPGAFLPLSRRTSWESGAKLALVTARRCASSTFPSLSWTRRRESEAPTHAFPTFPPLSRTRNRESEAPARVSPTFLPLSRTQCRESGGRTRQQRPLSRRQTRESVSRTGRGSAKRCTGYPAQPTWPGSGAGCPSRQGGRSSRPAPRCRCR